MWASCLHEGYSYVENWHEKLPTGHEKLTMEWYSRRQVLKFTWASFRIVSTLFETEKKHADVRKVKLDRKLKVPCDMSLTGMITWRSRVLHEVNTWALHDVLQEKIRRNISIIFSAIKHSKAVTLKHWGTSQKMTNNEKENLQFADRR